MSDVPPGPGGGPDLAALRARLATARGPRLWRSLEELADDPAFAELVRHELPPDAERWPADLDRRRFLQLAAASLALSGAVGCTRQPSETIVPHVRAPEQRVPGRPQWFATAHLLDGWARGVLVESHEGRPTKVEGNPDHPASLGGTDLFAQASVIGLYDPDRSQTVTHLQRIATWDRAVDAIERAMAPRRARGGAGLALLTGTVTSPTEAALLATLRERLPEARWHRHAAAGGDAARLGAQRAFGTWASTRYDLSRADVVVSLDADLLVEGPAAVRYARDVMARRDRDDLSRWNRLYVLETAPTGTGTQADHRLAVSPSGLAAWVRALGAELGVVGGTPPEDVPHRAALGAIARDLRAHRGRCAVVPGDHAPAAVHVLAHAMNARLGNVGQTVTHAEPVEAGPCDQHASLVELVRAMRGGEVDMLVVLGGNPVYEAPAALGFAEAMDRVALRVHLGPHADETAERCHWHLPRAHDLEAWGDARAFDGTATIVQPLIAPLYGGRTPAEVLARLLGRATGSHDLVRDQWRGHAEGDLESPWRHWLHDGVVPGTRAPALSLSVSAEAVARAADELGARAAPAGAGAVELALRPDPTVRAGELANDGWLQECPKPITTLTWGNALLLAPATADALGVGNEERVAVETDAGRIEVPAWLVPGHAEGAATLHLGGGRRRAGRLGDGVGVDAAPLRPAEAPFSALARVRGTGARAPLAATQHHHAIDDLAVASRAAADRDLVRQTTVAAFAADPRPVADAHDGHPPSLHPDVTSDGPSWGMAIDLSRCTSCNACVVACQAENNVPVVGEEQVRRGREMHWLRVDRYFEGDLDRPRIHAQPLPCMHCEQAPCEVVCPVSATVHSEDGLNDMVYNRCVGTRYCSNNCPYKVRRFNFLHYAEVEEPVASLQHNPDVTVRARGVMEKCTFCVQRIRAAGIAAEREGRAIADSEVVPACAQACPTDAIVFGDVTDPDTRVSAAKRSALDYGLLEHLGTRPRTSYLARLRNPNPELAEGG